MYGYVGFSYDSDRKPFSFTLTDTIDVPDFAIDNSQHQLQTGTGFHGFHASDNIRQYDVSYGTLDQFRSPPLMRHLQDELFWDPYGTAVGNYYGVYYGRGPYGELSNALFAPDLIPENHRELNYQDIQVAPPVKIPQAEQKKFIIPRNTTPISNNKEASSEVRPASDLTIGYPQNGVYYDGYSSRGYGGASGFGIGFSYPNKITTYPSVNLEHVAGKARVFDNSQYNDYTGTSYGEALHWLEVFKNQAASYKAPSYITLSQTYDEAVGENPTGVRGAFGSDPLHVPVIDVFDLGFGGLKDSKVWQNYYNKHIITEHGGIHDVFTPLIF